MKRYFRAYQDDNGRKLYATFDSMYSEDVREAAVWTQEELEGGWLEDCGLTVEELPEDQQMARNEQPRLL